MEVGENVDELLASLFPSGPHLSGVSREVSVSRGQILVRPEWLRTVVPLLSRTSACLLNTASLPCLPSMTSLLESSFLRNPHLPSNHSWESLSPLCLCDRALAPRGNPPPPPSSTIPLEVPHLPGRLGAWVAGKRGSLVADSHPSEVLARARCSENSDLCRMAGTAGLIWKPL